MLPVTSRTRGAAMITVAPRRARRAPPVPTDASRRRRPRRPRTRPGVPRRRIASTTPPGVCHELPAPMSRGERAGSGLRGPQRKYSSLSAMMNRPQRVPARHSRRPIPRRAPGPRRPRAPPRVPDPRAPAQEREHERAPPDQRPVDPEHEERVRQRRRRRRHADGQGPGAGSCALVRRAGPRGAAPVRASPTSAITVPE